jgi:hypothetical protein
MEGQPMAPRKYTEELAAALRRGLRRRPAAARRAGTMNLTDLWAILVQAGMEQRR